jgi:SSS family solute:Na+ symporter
LSAFTIDRLVAYGVIPLSGQGPSFVAAIVAFVVDIVASVIITMFTTPRPAAELTGLVWSLTPRDGLRQAEVGADAAWYRKPVLLGGVVLLVALALNIIFW